MDEKTIEYGSIALGGVQGVVTAVAAEFTGATDKMAEGAEYATVGIDSLLRRDAFAKVYGENQDKSSDNATYNQTTGIGIVSSVILPGVGKAVLKGKGGPDTKPDAPVSSLGGTSSGGNLGSAKTAPDKAGEVSRNSPTVPNRTLNRSQIDEIVATPKGQHPDPSVYMSQAELNAHLAQFDAGAVRFT